MRGKSNFYKHLVRIFWLSLIVGTVGIWYYVDRSIPDRVSVTEHDQEEFTFSLPWRATVYSESEEVALGNKSNIPAEQIHYDIADWAIAGYRLLNLGSALWFYNPYSPNCRPNFPSEVGYFVVRIGDHCFYNPTSAYFDT